MAYEVDRCVVISVHQLFSGEVLRGIGAWMVRTLNAQFCRAPDCVLRTSGANLNILDGLNHDQASSPPLVRISIYSEVQSVKNSLIFCSPFMGQEA